MGHMTVVSPLNKQFSQWVINPSVTNGF